MRYSVERYSDPVLDSRRGFLIQRLDTGEYYFLGFTSRPTAEWRASTSIDSHPRFWVSTPDEVTFTIADQLRKGAAPASNAVATARREARG